MGEQTLISRQSLAKRWDFTDTKVIYNYEAEGIITRIPGIPSPRYSMEEIFKIENLGGNINPLSPLERRRLEKKLEEKDKKIQMLEDKINNIIIALK